MKQEYLLFLTFMGISVLADKPKPVMISIVFRHGHRAPDKSAVYPKDPYKNNTYEPEGYGNLTQQGKDAAYRRGEMIRQNYSDLIGETYNPSEFVARSTNRTRTNMTLEYILAGMYSLKSVDHVNIADDILPCEYLYTYYFQCKKFKDNYNEVLNSKEVEAQTQKFDGLVSNVTQCIGQNVPNLFYLYALYGHLQSQAALGLVLPSCFDEIYPNGGLKDASLYTLKTLSYNDILSKLNGGPFLRNITQTMMDFKGNGTVEGKPKIHLYSAHDTSVAATFYALNLNLTILPYFCSAIVIELYHLKEQHFVKILYYPDDSTNFITMKMKNCEEMCPLDDFIELTRNSFPSDEDMQC